MTRWEQKANNLLEELDRMQGNQPLYVVLPLFYKVCLFVVQYVLEKEQQK